MGEPRLHVLADGCPIAVKQLKKWRNNERGEPAKEDDDSCENLYRLINLDTKYTEPEQEQICYYNNQEEKYKGDAGY